MHIKHVVPIGSRLQDSEMSWLLDLVYIKILLRVCNYLILSHRICRLCTACCCVPLVAYLTCIPIFACYSWCINITQNYLFIFFNVSLLCHVLSYAFCRLLTMVVFQCWCSAIFGHDVTGYVYIGLFHCLAFT